MGVAHDGVDRRQRDVVRLQVELHLGVRGLAILRHLPLAAGDERARHADHVGHLAHSVEQRGGRGLSVAGGDAVVGVDHDAAHVARPRGEPLPQHVERLL